MSTLLSIGFVILISVSLAFFVWMIDRILSYRWERKMKERRKRHPELYRLIAERDKLCLERRRAFNSMQFYKDQIDEILKDYGYLPISMRSTADMELEKLRIKIQNWEAVHQKYRKQIKTKQAEIDAYMAKNNLEKW